MAPGLTLDNWHANTLQATLHGVVDAVPVTGGKLYKAVVTLALEYVQRTGT